MNNNISHKSMAIMVGSIFGIGNSEIKFKQDNKTFYWLLPEE